MKYMAPIWLRHPEAEPASTSPRTGAEEAYLHRWLSWMKQLPAEERRQYDALFPAPLIWQEEAPCGTYRHGGVALPLWRDAGQPKYSLQHAAQEPPAEFCFFWAARLEADGNIGCGCLSQWWKSNFMADGVRYCCMEQFMMAQKAALFGDEEIRQQILACTDPAGIKQLGRQVRNFDPAVWDQAKYTIILNGNWRKFSQNPRLRSFLLSTGDRFLAEASPYDTIWGIGLTADQAADPRDWRGENLLGLALMEVRDELARVWANAALLEDI